MTEKKWKFILLPFALVMLLVTMSACGAKEPTLDIDAQKTGFAQTAEAQAALTAQAQPTATKTPEATLTPTPTETPISTATAGPSPTTAPVSGNDVGQWRAQDPPDNTEFSPGEVFTVTWTIENTGTSTWTTGYYIESISGEPMDAGDKVYLPYNVPPGTSVQISVELKAPSAAGEYKSVWSLANANETVFYSNFYIVINVVE